MARLLSADGQVTYQTVPHSAWKVLYVEKTLKLLPDKPTPSLLGLIWHNISNLGRIHHFSLDFHFSSIWHGYCLTLPVPHVS